MNYYGIKGPLIKWFENYLYQRKQKVINRTTSSTVCEVSAGVRELSIELYSSNNWWIVECFGRKPD
jgi:hypothetical protein